MLQSSYFVTVREDWSGTQYTLQEWRKDPYRERGYCAKEMHAYHELVGHTHTTKVVLAMLCRHLPEGHWHQAGRVYNYYESSIGSDCCIREAGSAEAREKTNQHQAEGK